MSKLVKQVVSIPPPLLSKKNCGIVKTCARLECSNFIDFHMGESESVSLWGTLSLLARQKNAKLCIASHHHYRRDGGAAVRPPCAARAGLARPLDESCAYAKKVEKGEAARLLRPLAIMHQLNFSLTSWLIPASHSLYESVSVLLVVDFEPGVLPLVDHGALVSTEVVPAVGVWKVKAKQPSNNGHEKLGSFH